MTMHITTAKFLKVFWIFFELLLSSGCTLQAVWFQVNHQYHISLLGCTSNSNTDRLTLYADWHWCLLSQGLVPNNFFSICFEEFFQLWTTPEMLPLPPLLLLLFPAAVFVAAQDLHGFTLPGGSAGFDPTGRPKYSLMHQHISNPLIRLDYIRFNKA